MITPVAIEVMDLNTSRDVWKALEVLFGTANRSRANQLRMTLQTARKGTMKMEDYLILMKQNVDNMAFARDSVSTNSPISCVLAGLDAEYLPVVCQINAKESINWQEFWATLMTFENTLEQLNLVNANLMPAVANLAINKQGNYNKTKTHGQHQNQSQPSAAFGYHCFNENYMGSSRNQSGDRKAAAYIASPEIIADQACSNATAPTQTPCSQEDSLSNSNIRENSLSAINQILPGSDQEEMESHEPAFEMTQQQHESLPRLPCHPMQTKSKSDSSEDLPCFCSACCKRIDDFWFFLRCSDCNFNLDILCSFRKADVKCHHHEDHDLLYLRDTADLVNEFLCSVCNTLCDAVDFYRCVECNVNIHPGCLSLPTEVNSDFHVHPFILTSSIKEGDDHDDSRTYYCDICEERMSP
ncbi:hypothetical protein FEM48_Zijuj10G0012200 [Ziziphus jujuba var. spinosa]|uniref:Uncharacterized protein n=1 Tax=Ziziphus jujuba var. spinosa TaxID=714518 RepID=A0A978UKE9_ZIZJJ|nr:hypothetical protein FEM48_Zijuj10G0012200 [Ziziphus jujuba var. spinosa]